MCYVQVGSLTAVGSGVVLGRHVGDLPLPVLGEEAMASGPRVIQDEVELLVRSGDVEPLLVPGFRRRNELDHGVGPLRFRHRRCL